MRPKTLRQTCGARVSLALVVVILSGCAGKHPIQIAASPGINALSTWITAVKAAVSDGLLGDGKTPEERRNRALSYSEALVLARYGEVRQNLVNGRAVTAVAFDALNLGLTAAVPIVNGERGKTILGALATGFLGLHNSLEKNVFQQQSSGALLTAMDTCITRQRRMLVDRRMLSIGQYDEYAVYSDLVQLYGCTTMAGAVQELTETQAVESKNQKQVIAPVSATELTAFQSIQAAFSKSVTTDKKAAVRFLTILKVPGISETSTNEELLAAYRGLLAAASTSTEFRKSMQDAAREAGLTGS
jgi:hypothetical protein